MGREPAADDFDVEDCAGGGADGVVEGLEGGGAEVEGEALEGTGGGAGVNVGAGGGRELVRGGPFRVRDLERQKLVHCGWLMGEVGRFCAVAARLT